MMQLTIIIFMYDFSAKLGVKSFFHLQCMIGEGCFEAIHSCRLMHCRNLNVIQLRKTMEGVLPLMPKAISYSFTAPGWMRLRYGWISEKSLSVKGHDNMMWCLAVGMVWHKGQLSFAPEPLLWQYWVKKLRWICSHTTVVVVSVAKILWQLCQIFSHSMGYGSTMPNGENNGDRDTWETAIHDTTGFPLIFWKINTPGLELQ